ncbi:MAG TPA: DUF4105 domain-containing protein [Polyangiaceae bacterium]|nr:DUF4105 domain-containing protein [Polyangiaceae bacterium]
MALPASLALIAATALPPQIDVYTMGQGEHLFERFGHAAICVTRASQSRCYNYGTTDFGSPPEELGYAFLRGTAEFWVSVWDRDRMLQQYKKHDRSVWRQHLNVTHEVARAVAARLEHDAKPENRAYVYHHFRDNCSTRVRDVLDAADAGALRRSSTAPIAQSYRGLARQRLAGQSQLVALADVVVGRGADAPLSVWEGMFLPDLLRSQLKAHYGAEPEVVYTRRGAGFGQRPAQPLGYHLGVGAVFTLAVGLASWRRWTRAASVLTGLTLASVAMVLWGVALLSQVPELRINEAVLVFWPTDVLLLHPRSDWRARYLALRLFALLLLFALLAVGVLRQPLLGVLIAVAAPIMVLWRAHASVPPATARDTRG